jgi:esterase/lipase superfamily enzyme
MNIVSTTGVAILALGLACCAVKPPPEVLLPQGSAAGTQKSVVVLAATTRERMNDNPYLFTSGRTAAVNYQEYVISIPSTHAVGQVEAPSRARGDPQTEFVTISNRPLSDQGFAKALGSQLASQTDL